MGSNPTNCTQTWRKWETQPAQTRYIPGSNPGVCIFRQVAEWSIAADCKSVSSDAMGGSIPADHAPVPQLVEGAAPGAVQCLFKSNPEYGS